MMRKSANWLCLVAGVVFTAAWPANALAASTITGTVTYAGTMPKLNPLSMDADPACAKKHTAPVANEMLVLGPNNSMANILVWVSKGVPAGKTYPAPTTPATLDQKGCQYLPHVQDMMVGQPYKILNEDGILHNVHALPKVNKQFNQPMPGTMKEKTVSFDKPEDVFQIKCDVHPWMVAYVGVYTHPFHATTKSDGKFTISGLDPGTYEITVWHERLGMQKATVTVAANETKAQNFKFAAPAAK